MGFGRRLPFPAPPPPSALRPPGEAPPGSRDRPGNVRGHRTRRGDRQPSHAVHPNRAVDDRPGPALAPVPSAL